jgi:hypothetical protein
MYFYKSSNEGGSTKNVADVVKRNELWGESKQKKIEMLKKEQDDEMKENCTFTPKMATDQGHYYSNIVSKSKRYGDRSVTASGSPTPTKVNNKAIEKFVHRQELARCLKEEKELYEQKLKAGALINHSSMKEINSKKQGLIKELSLPSNKDFSGIFHYSTSNNINLIT